MLQTLLQPKLILPHKLIDNWNFQLNTDDIELKWFQICNQYKRLITAKLQAFDILFVNRCLFTNKLGFKC